MMMSPSHQSQFTQSLFLFVSLCQRLTNYHDSADPSLCAVRSFTSRKHHPSRKRNLDHGTRHISHAFTLPSHLNSSFRSSKSLSRS
jgi:hypothetical protein